MSRVGQLPVEVPTGVDVRIDGRHVTAKGKLGELSLTLVEEVDLTREDDKLVVSPRNESKRARAMWGTSRSLLANIVQGVHEGFSVVLEITASIGDAFDGAVAEGCVGTQDDRPCAQPLQRYQIKPGA